MLECGSVTRPMASTENFEDRGGAKSGLLEKWHLEKSLWLMCGEWMGEWIRKYNLKSSAVGQAGDEVRGPGWRRWRSRAMEGMERCWRESITKPEVRETKVSRMTAVSDLHG